MASSGDNVEDSENQSRRWLGAVVSWLREDFEQSWEQYQQLASISEDAEFFLEYTQVALALGQDEVAVEASRQVIDRAGQDAEAMRLHALALMLTQAEKRALGVLTNLCKREKDYGVALAMLQHARAMIRGDAEPPRPIPEGWL